jgi:hypothetical protein
MPALRKGASVDSLTLCYRLGETRVEKEESRGIFIIRYTLEVWHRKEFAEREFIQ